MADLGIDISAHQGDIDLQTLKNNGVKFVILRAGYGTKGTIDNKFVRNADLCKQISMPIGVYWYSYALNVEGARKEAEAILNAIDSYKDIVKYGVWFDMEDADGYKQKNGMPSDQTLREMCAMFCKICEEAGYYSGIYASQSWFNNQLNGDEIKNYDKWVAKWPTSGGKQTGLSTDPSSMGGVNLWQFTSQAKITGYSDTLDADYAYISNFPNPGSGSDPDPEITPAGSTYELLLSTMQGEYGDGDTRKANLGTRYDEIQSIINHIATADANTLAEEVKNGTYGNGDARKIILGDRYSEVQAIVNNSSKTITKGCKIKFNGTTSYSGMKLASWTYGDTFNVIAVSGDRIVIGKGSAVTAAVKASDCEVV